jgi:hypothetical protein
VNTVDVFVRVAVEGTVDAAVALKLIQHVGAQADTVHVAYGKQRLLEKVSGYNQAAKGQPWLVLVDLDRCSCAVALLQKWVPQPSPYLCMRVAVRMVEAWLLADATNIADFLGVPVSRVPSAPEQLSDPKQEIVALAAQSRRRTIREDMVPNTGIGQRVGTAYTARLIEFIENHWDITQAASHAPSLQRSINCLTRVIQRHRFTLSGTPFSAEASL